MTDVTDSTSPTAKRALAGKRVVVGIGLLLLAVLLWSLRDTVPSWMASRMAATVELATTNERDDARVTRAFESAMRSQAADATLEPQPNQTKVRHTRLTVRAPTSDEAIDLSGQTVFAQQFCAERKLLPGWDGPRQRAPQSRPDLSGARLAALADHN